MLRSMPTPFAPPRVSVCLVAVPEVAAGVLHGLYEVLSFVGSGWEYLTGWPRQAGAHGRRGSSPRTARRSATASASRSRPTSTFAEAKRADIVIVGDLGVALRRGDPRALAGGGRLAPAQHAQGALVCSVCTGSLMLAEAGLLDGEEATCHWAATDAMRSRYPAVRLRPERVLVPAGAEHRLVTAGASASWTDLALYLVARFCGEEEARRTAKLFLFGDRSDGQLPFAARVRPRQHGDAAVAAAQVWIADELRLRQSGGRR